ncbi:uncharacterized protein B0H18DRAFT_521961 [Fomitopsis serialis]|uniref:uncharacterized protein n=1 Tax=Fomitopsis serialis TaxID=139415 RepID=UPI00200836FE|nr:uncharacterized protein B0H18DRAFT_521961 [Neoantrodia serialis]KAH9922189.1 hypothetical protein B0H18DRAFT_521961 [Neoantrodia serialis]
MKMSDTIPTAADQPEPSPRDTTTQPEGPAAGDAPQRVVDSSRVLEAAMDNVRRSTALARDFARVYRHEGLAAASAPLRVIDGPLLDAVDNARPEASWGDWCDLRTFAIIIAVYCMPVLFAIWYMPACFRNDPAGGLSVSVYCCADAAAICTLPGMGIFFQRCRTSSQTDLHSAAWEDYLELLGLSNDLVSRLTDQLWDQSASASAMARFAEKAIRQSDNLAHTDAERHLRDASATFAASTANFTLEAFELLDSEWAVAKSTSAMHYQLLQALHRVHHPLVGQIPYLMPERRRVAAYMFEAARDALRISIQHLSLRYKNVLTALNTVAIDLGRLRDNAAERCSPVSSTAALLMQPVGEPAEDTTSCRYVLRELDSAHFAIATCAAPLFETWSSLADLDSRVHQADDRVRQRDRDVGPLGKADMAAIERAVAEMEMVVGQMERILTYQGFKGFANRVVGHM